MILKIKNFFKRFNFKKKKNQNTLKESSFSKPKVDGIIKREKTLTQNSFKKIEIVKEVKKKDSLGGKDESLFLNDSRRAFIKVAGATGLGIMAAALLPKGADAYVSGSTPTSNVVGVKNVANTKINPATEETLSSLVVGVKDDTGARINPATEDTLSSIISGQNVEKFSVNLSSSGVVYVPSFGKRIRVYASRFSLTADAASVSFRFGLSGTDHERYVSPKTGGLYGANNHPNYIEGGVDEVLYCDISGTTIVQVNIDYLEV